MGHILPLAGQTEKEDSRLDTIYHITLKRNGSKIHTPILTRDREHEGRQKARLHCLSGGCTTALPETLSFSVRGGPAKNDEEIDIARLGREGMACCHSRRDKHQMR